MMCAANDASDLDRKRSELESLRGRVRQLESELELSAKVRPWRATGSYPAYDATSGFLLGSIAATSSLLLNIVGASLFGKHPLELIRVYLTFPMGEKALSYDTVDNGLILAIGCCLYLGTGMLYGSVFQVLIARFVDNAALPVKFIFVSALALAIWVVNFYGILAWLQPLLFGGDWIIESIPWWVAALTHLVFGWTMLAVYPLGKYEPYRPVTEQS